MKWMHEKEDILFLLLVYAYIILNASLYVKEVIRILNAYDSHWL